MFAFIFRKNRSNANSVSLERDERGPCAINTTLEKRLLFVLTIVVLIGIALCIAVAANSKEAQIKFLNHSGRLCLSRECISADILETYHSSMTEHENKTRLFYEACMNPSTRSEESIKILMKDLKGFGGWPMLDKEWDASSFNWTKLMVQLFQSGYPMDSLFNIGVDIDIKNITTSLIVVSEPELGISQVSPVIFSLKDKTNVERYKMLILDLAKLLQPDIDENAAKNDIEKAFEIEKKLSEVSIGPISNLKPSEFYNIKNFTEMQKYAPKIPWRFLLEKILPPSTEIHDDQKVMIANPRGMTTLIEILNEIDQENRTRDLANYMLYRVVLFAAEHMDLDTVLLTQYRTKSVVGRQMNVICADFTSQVFHMSITKSYVESYLTDRTRYELEAMFEDIQVTLLNSIRNAPWLDSETKEKAILKVKKMRSAMAYRDEILDDEKLNEFYETMQVGDVHLNNVKEAIRFKTRQALEGLNSPRERFSFKRMKTVLTANAFYQPNSNSIIIPVGILQDPFFTSGRPNYLNYGSLGSILGHEFTHAFDATGSLYDEIGNNKGWWTRESWKKFEEREQCYVDQYDGYYEKAVNLSINGYQTLNENIADNGGLKASYEAYMKLLERKGWEQQLPGLQYSERQMFWIGFGSIWCRKQTNYIIKKTIEKSPHALAKFRVNGAVSNMKEFAEDFKCADGAPLKPKSRCSLWK